MRATKSRLSGKPVPAVPADQFVEEALTKLKLNPKPGRAYREYNCGVTKQVPSGIVFDVSRRTQRKLGWNKALVRYETARRDTDRTDR